MPEFVTPETTDFLYLGLGSVFVLTVGYIASLFVRERNLNKDLQLIEQLQNENES